MKKFMTIAALVLAAVFSTFGQVVPMADEADANYQMATNALANAKMKWSVRRQIKRDAEAQKKLSEGLREAGLGYVTSEMATEIVRARRIRGEKLFVRDSHVLWEPAGEKLQRQAVNTLFTEGIKAMPQSAEKADVTIKMLTDKFNWK